MGALYSIPLCSKGSNLEEFNPDKTPGSDLNNNESTAAGIPASITEQPNISTIPEEEASRPSSSSTTNNVENDPDATSTPRSSPKPDARHSPNNISLSGSDEVPVADRALIDQTSDSGLDNSSDDLELSSVHRRRHQREGSTEGSSSSVDDEGVHDDTTINLNDESTDEVEDPVERPPEPTIPPSSSDEDTDVVVHNKIDSTSNAISNLLDEIVLGPHGHHFDLSNNGVVSNER